MTEAEPLKAVKDAPDNSKKKTTVRVASSDGTELEVPVNPLRD